MCRSAYYQDIPIPLFSGNFNPNEFRILLLLKRFACFYEFCKLCPFVELFCLMNTAKCLPYNSLFEALSSTGEAWDVSLLTF